MHTQQARPGAAEPDIKDADEDVLIAVQALGNMRHRAAHPSSSSSHMALPTIVTNPSTPALSPSVSTDTLPLGYDRNASLPLTARMSDLPFVHSAIRAYEHGKASSRVVKFGAEMVESSVITVAKPVLNHLDGFASSRFGRLSARLNSDVSPTVSSTSFPPMSQDPPPKASGTSGSRDPPNRQVTNSRWQSVLLEAGGIGAAVSTESMRRLKYCLQWLQYATARIDDQILALQNLIRAQSSHPPSDGSAAASPRTMQINRIRGDLVMTIRQVVEIISNYAGSALPEPARTRVRDFILSLPQRWATAQGGGDPSTTASTSKEDGQNPIAESSAREELKGRRRPRGRSRQNSASLLDLKRAPPVNPTSASEPQVPVPASEQANTNASARRILTLATESLDMLHNVTTIFSQSLERAEAWVERLRMIGMEPPETDPRHEEPEERETNFGRVGSSSTISSPFPETPVTRLSRPPSRTSSEDEATDSEEDPERPPRKTMKKDPDSSR